MLRKKKLTISYGGATHVGMMRSQNQDSYGKFPEANDDLQHEKGQLFIVADGLGGHVGGQEASRLAVVQIAESYFLQTGDDLGQNLCQAIQDANNYIHEQAIERPELHGMGTTCTMLLAKDKFCQIAHVGDSRAYHVTAVNIQQLTRDHTRVAELQRQGLISEEEARYHPERSILYRALGTHTEVEIDLIRDIPLKPGESFVLCSDGMSRLALSDVRDIVIANTPQIACDKLVELANELDGDDNVTVQIVHVN
jgi:protein phosphatase